MGPDSGPETGTVFRYRFLKCGSGFRDRKAGRKGGPFFVSFLGLLLILFCFFIINFGELNMVKCLRLAVVQLGSGGVEHCSD